MDFNSNITFIIRDNATKEIIIDQHKDNFSSDECDLYDKEGAAPPTPPCLTRTVSVSYQFCDRRLRISESSEMEHQECHTNQIDGKQIKRCASVKAVRCDPRLQMIQPRGVMTRDSSVVNLYELVDGGWVGSDVFYKSKLNLDDEIEGIMGRSCTAEVSLGNIKVVF